MGFDVMWLAGLPRRVDSIDAAVVAHDHAPGLFPVDEKEVGVVPLEVRASGRVLTVTDQGRFLV